MIFFGIKHFFLTYSLPKQWKSTFVSWIPNVDNSRLLKEYLPISYVIFPIN